MRGLIARWFCERHPQVFLVRVPGPGHGFCRECHRDKWRRVREAAIAMGRDHERRDQIRQQQKGIAA